MDSKPTVGALSQEFARLMRWKLTGEQMQNVMDHHDETTCKSHDYLDANDLMLDALGAFNIKEYNGTEELDKLINDAWNMAQDNRWYVPHFVSDTGWCEDCGGVCEGVLWAVAEYKKKGLM